MVSSAQSAYSQTKSLNDKICVGEVDSDQAKHLQLNNRETEKQYTFQVEQTSLLALPIEMIGNILSYLPMEDSFFWHYGLVCKSFLKEVGKMMKEANMQIQLSSEVLFEAHLDFICNDNDVANVVDEVGLDLSNKKALAQGQVKTIIDRCSKMTALNLSFCELTVESIIYLQNLSLLERLNLSCCNALNDQNLTILLQGCTKLKQLDLLMCENISDTGKSKYLYRPRSIFQSNLIQLEHTLHFTIYRASILYLLFPRYERHC